ncbi:uncharacterized protein PGTG_21466 [Puccinia graminis f. sp. tritici CRL 75-36-700-3]|uniref:Uncharacterized protein n=1 Tax=Puccinia graminis f. sp. tritici (strain CRL 75-36-700-3 / race SCCL) TaxID=418459 RepID=H6QRU7_PUCGT|nr:uncharacterized protein PGTG_21466 [Puccinia graminis f. sp. tritici CRL 75-36-700-3]EHS63389.1 hypothetical protein PGTG_21466 [Puccinia graminis f. sp. tritici CRL 75-36-700-3]
MSPKDTVPMQVCCVQWGAKRRPPLLNSGESGTRDIVALERIINLADHRLNIRLRHGC